MPCIYAHHSFGKKVAARLSPELNRVIRHHPEEFYAGLQGPDFLFFYHPMFKLRTNQMGYWQHGQSFAPFLKALLPIIRREGTDSGTYAYILGYICHFMLDSECHSFVIPLSKKPGYNHLAIENEFDRHLLKQDGFAPVTYPIWKLVHCSKEIVNAIHKTYRPLGLSNKAIQKSIRGMRFYKHMLTCGFSLKRFLIRAGMRLTRHYRELEGHMMYLFPKKYAKKTNQSLQYLYDNAIASTAELLTDFHKTVLSNHPLNTRFQCTFKSNVLPDDGTAK